MFMTKKIAGYTFATLTALTAALAGKSALAENPIVYDSGVQQTGYSVDPDTGEVRNYQSERQVYRSAYDPYRNTIDPGSKQYIDTYTRDSFGRVFHVRGWVWRSLGVPHSNLTRTFVQRVDPNLSPDVVTTTTTQSYAPGNYPIPTPIQNDSAYPPVAPQSGPSQLPSTVIYGSSAYPTSVVSRPVPRTILQYDQNVATFAPRQVAIPRVRVTK